MKIRLLLATGVFSFCPLLFAEEMFFPHQLEAIVGFNHTYHDFSSLDLSNISTTEKDSLHSDNDNNDVTWGFAYAYNILPWFVGYQQRDPQRFLQHVLLGVDLLFLDNTDTGDVYQFKDPSMDNFKYHFKVDTTRLMLNSEIDFKSFWENIFPYVQASVGVARIESQYHDTPYDAAVGGGISTKEHTDYNLAYSLGTGLKYYWAPYFQFSLSYLYTGFGEVETSDNFLEDHLSASSALFGVTYLFP